MIRSSETGDMFERDDGDDIARVPRHYEQAPDANGEDGGCDARAVPECNYTVQRHIDRLLAIYQIEGARIDS